MNSKWFFALIAFFLLALPTKSWSRSVSAFVSELDKYIETTRTTWGVPGIAVGVIQDDEILLLKGYGVSDLETNRRVNTHTVFQIGSLSKTFASTLAGILAEQKKLSFDTPITRYLPGLVLGSEEHTSQITLRHVLNHTTGFPHHAGDPRIEGGEAFQKIIASLATLKILYQPGKVHDYQNAIYSLSGSVIEKATGMSYAQAIQTYFLKPLGMTDTTVGLNGFTQSENTATPYRYGREKHNKVKLSTNYYTVLPAAGINGSIADMTTWLRLQMGMVVLTWNTGVPGTSVETLKEIHKPSIATPKETRHMRPYQDRVKQTWYGLGWRIYDWSDNKIICHGGMLNGFKSLLSFSPDKKAGIVILTNSTSAVSGMIRSYFFDKLFDQPFVDWNQYFKEQDTKAAQRKATKRHSRSKSKRKKKK